MNGWQERITRFVHRIETKIDEQRHRHGGRFFARKAARVVPYRGYGTAERAFLKGRVLRGSPLPPAAEDDSVWLNLASMVQRFESDEVPHARVRVRHAGGEVVVEADDEGYWEAWIEPRPPFSADALWHEVHAELVEPEEEPAPDPALAHLLVPPPQAALGVISDLDDTVVSTDATSFLRMFRNVLLANARTRVPFPGVAAFYRALQHGAGAASFNPIFYVSSSPWNLYDLLTEFLTLQKIPLGPLMLRDWGISERELIPTGHGVHKREAIERILGLFPALPFVLIGDSGQEDPEIYHRVVHDHPDRVAAVYIRNVTPHPEREGEIRALAEEVRAAGSTLLLTDDMMDAAEDAAARGWIVPKALDEIRAEVARDHEEEPGATTETEALNREVSTGVRGR